jgi:sugar phosphate isomerase/epimerase
MANRFDVRIGINPIGWMNDDLPSLGGDTKLETALSEGKEIGYEGFELGNKFPKEPTALKAKLGEFGLACVSGWYSGRLAKRSVEEEIRAVGPHLELLARNGAKVMVYGEVQDSIQGEIDTPLFKRPQFTSESDWKAYGERLTAFGRYLLTRGVRLGYHHHMGAYCETPDNVDTLMRVTGDEVGLLFDTGHMAFAGAGAENDWRREALRDGLNTQLSQLSKVKVYSKEFIDFLITRKGLTEIKDGVTKTDRTVTDLNASLKSVEEENERLQSEFNKLQRLYLNRQTSTLHHPSSARRGMVSDECAAYLAATFIQQCAKCGKLELLSQSSATRDALLNTARQTLGMEVRTALTTTDIPLPVGYSGELRALIAQFGVVRQHMFPYPIGMGVAKPPRMGNRPQFASVALSGAIPEGSPTITFARGSDPVLPYDALI